MSRRDDDSELSNYADDRPILAEERLGFTAETQVLACGWFMRQVKATEKAKEASQKQFDTFVKDLLSGRPVIGLAGVAGCGKGSTIRAFFGMVRH